jgi:hypothetical protein
MDPKNCPMCGEPVTPHVIYIWHVSCGGCYDGAPDAGPQLHAFSTRESEAIEDWNEQVAEYEEELAEQKAADEAVAREDLARELEYDRKEERGLDRWRGLE